MNANEELKSLGNFKKIGCGVGGWGQGGFERRIEDFVKIKKKIGRGMGSGGRVGGQGGCERRIEVIVKIKKNRGWGWVGGRVEGSGRMLTNN